MNMKTFKQSTLALMVAACFSAAVAAPTVPQIVSGQAAFSQQGNVFSITNTPNTIINWQSFSVNAGEITRFIQQDANSAVLNRILGQDPSQILGALQSNGRVFLINPNGIVFGSGARVDVNGLVASTLDLSNADFLAGKKNFAAGATAGKVSNQGTISTPSGGQVYLIAPNVENSGVITSPQGEVVLAAGHTVQLVDSANPDLHVVVSAPADQAINLGQVIAQGGTIGIYGALVNQRGVVNANSAVVGQNGKIVFKASGDTLLEAGSVTSATGAGKGGTIEVLGDRVGLTGAASVDASGATGGGTVLVGGDYQGKNAAIQNAQQVFIDKDVSIRADAQQGGDGGKVIAWSDGITRVYGAISARGGANGGDGGLVETSGHVLDMQGSVDTRAPNGQAGMLLLDPTNIYIANDPTSAQGAGMAGVDISASSSPFLGVGTIADSLFSVSALQAQLALSNVTVSTTNANGIGTGDIKVVNPVSWSSANQLTLNAEGGIAVNNSITSTGGALTLNAGGGIAVNNNITTTGAALSLTSHSSAGITLNGSLSATNLSLRSYLGDITQPSGAITATSLLAYADDGTVALTNSANNVGTLAGWSGVHGSGFTFVNSSNLTVDVASGSHGVVSNHGPIALSTSSGDLTVNDLTFGVKAAGSNDSVTLSAPHGALQIAGVVQTNGGMATLTGASAVNLIGSGSVSTAGGAALAIATDAGGQFSMGAATQITSGGG
ncbi:MAG TPA: filamentous hemagglutinin N-terminal domain-containing protein, partial [Telluria sp.]|nr:filamentous hemagglutinin N-terminal domain-containing protein [Telluria sp.]